MKTKIELRYLDHLSTHTVNVNYDFKEKIKLFKMELPVIKVSKNTPYNEAVYELLLNSLDNMLVELNRGNYVVYMYYVDYPLYKRRYNAVINQYFKLIKL